MATSREMLVSCVSTFLFFCSLAVSHSAPPVCEKLVHPLESAPQNLWGRWSFIAGSISDPVYMEALSQRDSITVYFSNSSGAASTTSYAQTNRFGDECQFRPYNVSLQGGAFTFDVANRFNLTATLVGTSCSDCLVMHWVMQSTKRSSVDVYLLSRRRRVEQEELEEFGAQLKCYGLPAPVLMDPTKEICPDQPESKETTTPEEATSQTA